MSEAFTDRVLAAQSIATPWLDVFLAEYVRTEGDEDAAAELAHVTLVEFHTNLAKNKVIKAAFTRAQATVRTMRAGRLETAAYHEAVFPSRKYKFTPAGKPIEHPEHPGEMYFEQDRDNRLVLGLLKSLAPEVYGDHHVVTGAGGGPIVHAHLVATLADVVKVAAMVEAGKILPTEVVGELPDDAALDAEVVE